MENFLRETRHNLLSLNYFEKVRVVMGNEACDLDSAISALVYSYFLFKTNTNPDMAIIPVLNIPREDFSLRTEVTFFLAQNDIHADLLIFRDEIDLLQIYEGSRLMLSLVDHNVLAIGDAMLEHAVVEVIDHHRKERDDEDERCEVTIEMVGSCCTLVAEKVLNKEPDLLDEKIANLLYGTILLDTVGLSMDAGRVTSKDEDIVRQLELSVRYPNPEELFQTLQNVKFDLSGLNPVQLLRKDLKVIQNATMTIAISSVPVLIEDFVKRSNIEEELENVCSKYSYNILVIMGIAVTSDNVAHRQMGIYSKIHSYRDQVIDVLESADNPSLELEMIDIGMSTIVAFNQIASVSRKKVLPLLKTFLVGDITPPEGSGFENAMLLNSESFSKLEITGQDVSEELENLSSSQEECESPLEFPENQQGDYQDSSDNFVDFNEGGIDNPAFTTSLEESTLECDGNGCPPHDLTNISSYDPFTTITVNNPDNEPILLLYDGDSELPEASNSSSNQDTCPATPASSFVDGNFDEITEQHLPSFNSREMTEIIETKKAKLGGYELDPSNQTYPFTPKNSFVDSTLESFHAELPTFDSESILQKIQEKKMSLETFDSEDGDENVFPEPGDSGIDFDIQNLSSQSHILEFKNNKERYSFNKSLSSDQGTCNLSQDSKEISGHSSFLYGNSFRDDIANVDFIKTFSQRISSESENGFADKFAETFSMQVEQDGLPADVLSRRQSKDSVRDFLRKGSKHGVDGLMLNSSSDQDVVLSPGSYGGKGDAVDSGYIDLSNGESSAEIHKFSPDDMLSTGDVDSEKIFDQKDHSIDDNPGAFSGTEEHVYYGSQGSNADWSAKQVIEDNSSYEDEDGEGQQCGNQVCADVKTQGITNLAFEDDDDESADNLKAQSTVIVENVLKQSENILKQSSGTSLSKKQSYYHPLMTSLELESHSSLIVQNVLKESEKVVNRIAKKNDKSPDKISSEGTEDESTSDTQPSDVSSDKITLNADARDWEEMSASVISESQKTEGDPFTSSIEMDSSMEYLGTIHGKKLHGGLIGDDHFYEHSEFDFEIPITRLPAGIGMVSIAESETKADGDELSDENVNKSELPMDKNGNALPEAERKERQMFVEIDTQAMKEIYHTTAGLIGLPLELNEQSRLDDIAKDYVLCKDNPLLPDPYQLDENLLAAADKLIEMTEAAKTAGHGLVLQPKSLRHPTHSCDHIVLETNNTSCDLTKDEKLDQSLTEQSIEECVNYELETIDFPESPDRINLRVQLETSQEVSKDEDNTYRDENEIPEEIALQAGLSPVTEDGIQSKPGHPTSLTTHSIRKKKKIAVSLDAFRDKDDDHMSLHSDTDPLSFIDDSASPDDINTPEELDDSVLQDDWDDKPKISEKIPELSAEEELEEERSWRTVTVAGIQHKIDMKVIEPYKKVLSHGGYYGSGLNAIIVFTACYLPDRGRKDYDYVMDNLFLYVISTLDLLVAEDYILVYLHGATPRRNVPNFGWLKRCYQMIDRRLRKNLKGLYLVHPTFWLKTIVIMTKPFISTKFSSKLRFVSSLKELGELIPLEYVFIPEKVQQYDDQKYGVQ